MISSILLILASSATVKNPLPIPEHRNLRLRFVGLWFSREQLVAGNEGRADGQKGTK